MAIGGAFLGGGVEVVPAGSCKLELEILTEDRKNLTATFTIKGTSTYTVTAGADGRAVYTVPSGQTYTVSVNTTGYDNIASQTVVAESGTVRYVRFEAFLGRVKRSGDVINGTLTFYKPWIFAKSANADNIVLKNLSITGSETGSRNMSIDHTDNNNTLRGQILFSTNKYHSSGAYLLAGNGGGVTQSICIVVNDNGTYNANAPTPSDSTDNSTQIATTAWVNGASSVVHTGGDEVIQGYKKFSKSPITTAWTGYHITLPGMTKGEKVASVNTNLYTGFFDKNDTGTNQPANMMAGLRFTVPPGTESTPPNTFIELSNQYYRDTYLRLYDNGTTAYATCPNPPSDATTNQITTASWTIGKFVKKIGDTMTGRLTMSGASTLYAFNGSDVTPITFTNELNGNTSMSFMTAGLRTSMIRSINADTSKQINLMVFGSEGNFSNYGTLSCIYNVTKNEYYANAPSWSVGTNDNSNKVLTIAMANKLPSLVHTSDNEQINGQKTFTSKPIVRKNGYGSMDFFNTNANPDTVGNWALMHEIGFYGTDGTNDLKLGGYYISTNGDGDPRTVIQTRRMVDGEAKIGEITIRVLPNGTSLATAPTPPTNANYNEIATAKWVNDKLAQKSKVTNVTSYAQLIELIRNGKRGDSFGLTMDYTAGSFGGIIITAEAVAIHAFGHYTLEELTVSDGNLSSFQAFGSGEVSGAFFKDDNTTYTYATSGFGRSRILQGYADAFRVVEDGELTYFLTDDETTTSFDGYYISI